MGNSEVSWGSATSVLGDFAVVLGVDVPAQTDGQQHPQELWGTVKSQGGCSLSRRWGYVKAGPEGYV